MSTLESLMRRCLALLAVSLVACTNDTPRTSTALVRDSAGVRIVESHAPQWDDVTAWRLGGAPLIDIGGETGDPRLRTLSRGGCPPAGGWAHRDRQ